MDQDELQEWYRRALKSRIDAMGRARTLAAAASSSDVDADGTVQLATELRQSPATHLYPRIAEAAAALETAAPADVPIAADELLSALREAALGLTSPQGAT